MPVKKVAKAKPATKAKDPSTITKDGLFISRAMRRAAEAAAKTEADALAIQTDDYADAADAEAYALKFPGQSEAEKVFNSEKAQAQATAEARKKFGLK